MNPPERHHPPGGPRSRPGGGLADGEDELAYDSGGFSAGLWGVLLTCIIVWQLGTILGYRMSSVLAIAAACGVAGSAWVHHRMQTAAPRRRAESLRNVAADLGLVFRADVPHEALEQVTRLTVPHSSAGAVRRASNLLDGSYDGMAVHVLDFYHQTSSGTDSDTENWRTVVLIPDAHGVPEFHLRPRGLLDRVAAFLGLLEISFAGTDAGERFSRHYRLSGPQQAAIHAAFAGPAVSYLADHPGWHVACAGGTVAVWREGPTTSEATANFRLTSPVHPGFRYVSPQSVPKLLAWAVAIRRLFPGPGSG